MITLEYQQQQSNFNESPPLYSAFPPPQPETSTKMILFYPGKQHSIENQSTESKVRVRLYWIVNITDHKNQFCLQWLPGGGGWEANCNYICTDLIDFALVVISTDQMIITLEPTCTSKSNPSNPPQFLQSIVNTVPLSSVICVFLTGTHAKFHLQAKNTVQIGKWILGI